MPPYLDLSVLRVSKLISHEAMEILYSESVFVFVIDMNDHRTYLKAEKFSRLKRIAPLMKNVDIDIESSTLRTGTMFTCWWGTVMQADKAEVRSAKKFQRSLSRTIGLFEGVSIERRNLHIRLLNCSPCMPISTAFGTTCQRLGRLVGFRNATFNITISDIVPLFWRFPSTNTPARDLLSRISNAVTEELQPTFGPAISVSRFIVEPFSTPVEIFRRDGRNNFMATLKFHPGKQSIRKHVVEEGNPG